MGLNRSPIQDLTRRKRCQMKLRKKTVFQTIRKHYQQILRMNRNTHPECLYSKTLFQKKQKQHYFVPKKRTTTPSKASPKIPLETNNRNPIVETRNPYKCPETHPTRAKKTHYIIHIYLKKKTFEKPAKHPTRPPSRLSF